MHRGYSWLCTQELLLAMLRGPYGMLGIEPGSAACKANALPLCCCSSPSSWLFEPHPMMLRGSSWLCTQESLLAVLGGPYGMLGIEPGSAACKANALPAVLSLQPQCVYSCEDSQGGSQR